MGSIYASLLSQKGNKVFAIDKWEEHINEINKNGLKVEGASGNNIYKSLIASTKVPQDINFDVISYFKNNFFFYLSYRTKFIGSIISNKFI